jgi:cytochrome c biogenesis protein CcmG/thiol:disulfide interchange protein DsbE
MKRNLITLLPLLIFMALAVMLANRLIAPRITGTIDSPLIGKPLPDLGITHLPDGPFILNFFASWCGPCVLEHPHLMQFKRDGVTIIGVAFQDKPDAIAAFLKQHGNPYKSVVHDTGQGPAITMGITGVPESYAIDENHIIRLREQGPLEDPGVIANFMKVIKP